jgi:hypothetical protein
MKNTFLALLVTSAFTVSSAFGAAITDVTYEGAFADAAWGEFGGNESESDVNALPGIGDPFILLDKSDEDAGSAFGGVTFTLTADQGSTTGDWLLSWEQTGLPGLPLLMDFVFVAKASAGWSAYLFESISFTSDPTSGSGTFTISWLNGGGETPALSHASIYGRAGTIIDIPSGVPEPGMLVLFGTALLGLGLAKKRKFKA